MTTKDDQILARFGQKHHFAFADKLEFVFLLELKAALKDGDQAFDLQTIAQIMNKDEAQIYQLLHGLIAKGIIS